MIDIVKIKKWINEADAIIIGAGAGLSDAAGIHYSGEKFENDFKDFIKKYKITDKAISNIKKKAKETDGISSIEYHKEGRILNFTIIAADDFGVNQAKDFAGSLLEFIGEDSLKYYDIQFFIDSKGDTEGYPIIGYKSKNSESINYGNVGG